MTTEIDVAHIRGENKGAVRHDPQYVDVDHPDNLMLMFREQRRLIDVEQPEAYSVELLRKMRREHIGKIAAAMKPGVRAQVEAVDLTLVAEADAAIDFDSLERLLVMLSLHRARLERTRGRAIDEWADRLLRTQYPSGIAGLTAASRPQLEQALPKAATAGRLIVKNDAAHGRAAWRRTR